MPAFMVTLLYNIFRVGFLREWWTGAKKCGLWHMSCKVIGLFYERVELLWHGEVRKTWTTHPYVRYMCVRLSGEVSWKYPSL
jgi:hypothetical protein